MAMFILNINYDIILLETLIREEILHGFLVPTAKSDYALLTHSMVKQMK